ncbi:Acyl-[acyl-carrier-protein]--UDP-N-acetylglucosamine O-acyltransferase, partial [Frankliniella fusca]
MSRETSAKMKMFRRAQAAYRHACSVRWTPTSTRFPNSLHDIFRGSFNFQLKPRELLKRRGSTPITKRYCRLLNRRNRRRGEDCERKR